MKLRTCQPAIKAPSSVNDGSASRTNLNVFLLFYILSILLLLIILLLLSILLSMSLLLLMLSLSSLLSILSISLSVLGFYSTFLNHIS